ncbi:putative disulfide oxidoreductase YuzD [Sporosarcina luteola]|uniref:Putative disulfide oxidoreductase YuzD n=1 Tax=Sporosarcina luteola TaxID=582850 RepID=A0A511Z781_9BACL|nr:YuzD family protein [Sporosarcina luteola]GEN83307.1 putative disulfide oxidoreductase YuzD [Sporosarcina luteola]
MGKSKVKIEIYGADIICASCVNAPSSKDTYEWLQAAIDRKYPDQPVDIEYIDIESEIENPDQKSIAEQVLNDDYFYPLVMVQGEVIGEGYIQLKPVFAELEKHGYVAQA